MAFEAKSLMEPDQAKFLLNEHITNKAFFILLFGIGDKRFG